MPNKHHKYTKHEIDFIIKNYPCMGAKWCAEKLNIPINKIKAKVSYLNLKILNRTSVNKLDSQSFIKRSKEKHGNKYDYSLVVYNNQYELVKIICPNHGIFEQVAKSHMYGKGCSLCSGNIKCNTEYFIIKSKNINGDKYDYSLVNYINNKTPVTIICKKHGKFNQRPDTHLSHNQGCPSCCTSKGEAGLGMLLDNLGFNYIKQKTFNGCKFKRLLKFDFYIPSLNLCIEYDGIQHFQPHFKDKKGVNLKYTQKCDEIKNQYCVQNGVSLIRIKYDNSINVVNWVTNDPPFLDSLSNNLTHL